MPVELACRGYMDEPAAGFDPFSWPALFDAGRAALMRNVLRDGPVPMHPGC